MESEKILKLLRLHKAGTFNEFECCVCGIKSDLIRPSKSGGFYPTFCSKCSQREENVMNKMTKYEVTLSKKIFTTQEISSSCKEIALKAVQELIDNDNVCEFNTQEEDWEIESIEES